MRIAKSHSHGILPPTGKGEGIAPAGPSGGSHAVRGPGAGILNGVGSPPPPDFQGR